jgi:hypothetical protein
MMPAQFLASGIVGQFHRAESSRSRVNLNMRTPLHGLFSRAIDYGRVYHADGPSARSLRRLLRQYLPQYVFQPTLSFAQTIK